MRRLIIEEPYSKAALLSQRLAVFSLAVAIVGILGVGRGLDLLAVLGGSLIIACAAILSAILAFVVIWHSGRKGAGQAFAGLVLATVLLAYPAYLAQQTLWLPRLPDISTFPSRARLWPPAQAPRRQASSLHGARHSSRPIRRSNRFSSISMHRKPSMPR